MSDNHIKSSLSGSEREARIEAEMKAIDNLIATTSISSKEEADVSLETSTVHTAIWTEEDNRYNRSNP